MLLLSLGLTPAGAQTEAVAKAALQRANGTAFKLDTPDSWVIFYTNRKAYDAYYRENDLMRSDKVTTVWLRLYNYAQKELHQTKWQIDLQAKAIKKSEEITYDLVTGAMKRPGDAILRGEFSPIGPNTMEEALYTKLRAALPAK
jgi:hypothetical protein